LINNAIKFTNKGGFVKLAVKPLSEEEIEISVSDNGLGISDSMKAELFSIGRSKSMDGTAGEGGSGLGLMLSYEYIKINDGQIDVESEIGNGTSFRVRFKSC
jgi:signal transduction histidine kinase